MRLVPAFFIAALSLPACVGLNGDEGDPDAGAPLPEGEALGGSGGGAANGGGQPAGGGDDGTGEPNGRGGQSGDHPEPVDEDNDAVCNDGVDNDTDGYLDCDDFSCSKNPDVTVCGGGGGEGGRGGEPDPEAVDEDNDAVCNDGIDNDTDGYLDCDDYSCSRNPEVTICGTNPDPDPEPSGAESTDPACADGQDNDADGFVDCDDYDCSRNDAVTVCAGRPGGEDTDETCQDGLDNDSDGHLDCDDFDCSRNDRVSVCGGGNGGCDACVGEATGNGGACAGELEACARRGACQSILICVEDCAGRAGCADDCVASEPEGAPLYDDLISCVDARCADACE